MNKNEYEKIFPENLFRELERATKFYNPNERKPPVPFFPVNVLEASNPDFEDVVMKVRPADVISVYIHIPFCDRKCNFCDLYSFYIPGNRIEFIDKYVNSVVKEIHHWGNRINSKSLKITTMHFGGGSPLFLGGVHFDKIFRALEDSFTISGETEIALEMTTSEINENNINKILKYNFSRIHIGVQTFNDEIRNLLGRKEEAKIVLTKLEMLRKFNLILSADILYGLPNQLFRDFRTDLERFISGGLDGFALYELTRTKRLERINGGTNVIYPSSEEKYLMILYAKNLLNNSGYKNVFFNHYGNFRDKNLYFTFPVRGEDCLAFGSVADGRIGGFFYRNHKIFNYLKNIENNNSAIDFAYCEDPQRITVRRLEEQLMSAKISKIVFDEAVNNVDKSFKGIFDLWEYVGLIEPVSENNYELTGSGCWFLSDMLNQLRRLC
jgi:coproporphyrinogen III oxidase-like Fe-S oxidoreductase